MQVRYLTIVDASIKFSVNYVYAAGPLSANGLGWSKDDFKDKLAPFINSETRELTVIPEIVHHSCYLMQTIQIRESEALIFFDLGANIHVIDKMLAAKENLEEVCNTPTSLTVVGGNKVRSQEADLRHCSLSEESEPF